MGPPIPNVKWSALTLHINKQHETQQVVVIYLCIYTHMCNKEKEAIKSEETPRGMGLREGIQEERKVGRGILHFLKSLINCCSVNILLRGYHFMPAPQLSIAFSFPLVSLIPLLSSIWTYFVCPLSPGISLIRTCTDYSAYVDILAPAFLTILEKLYPLEQRVSRWKWSYTWNHQEKIFYLGPMDLPSPNYTSSWALPF